MAPIPAPDGRYDVVCPHCHKPFSAEVLTGSTERHFGFKCPHCRLFVPYERAEERGQVEPAP
jgi:transposase-like protein